jgi:hypothetical protein
MIVSFFCQENRIWAITRELPTHVQQGIAAADYPLTVAPETGRAFPNA